VNRHHHAPHLRIDPERKAIVLADVAKGLHREHRRQNVSPAATVLRRKWKSNQPELRAARPELARERFVAITRDEIVGERCPAKRDDRIAQLQLLGGPGEFHVCASF